MDAVVEQIAPEAQEDERIGHIPGNRGIWVGIFCVLVEFTLLFGVYFIAKAHNPDDFRAGPDTLVTTAGVAITLFLLTSGYCMVKALAAIRRGDTRPASLWVLVAIVLGMGYPIIKYLEISWYVDNGIGGGVFYGTYYYLTLNHLVHVSWGLMGLIWVGARTALGGYDAEHNSGLEAAALYWHTTDVIWLAIFPLFYVLR
ncbi:MAG: cytochrome c oxidase subunit 3 family protein [Pseudomonadota bacterium]|nr:cytochrome c oxidase subunit 3 family protein [Pseudomonadota bacterium]